MQDNTQSEKHEKLLASKIAAKKKEGMPDDVKQLQEELRITRIPVYDLYFHCLPNGSPGFQTPGAALCYRFWRMGPVPLALLPANEEKSRQAFR